MTYYQLDRQGDRPVQVQLDDGHWVPGLLEAARRAEGVWSGLVRYYPRRRAPDVNDLALVVMLGLLGLRIFEATGSDIEDLSEVHGLRVLRVHGKGDKVDVDATAAGRRESHRRAKDERTRAQYSEAEPGLA